MNFQSRFAFLATFILLLNTTLAAEYGQHCYAASMLSPTPATMLRVAKYICDGEKYVSFNTDCRPDGCCNLIEAWYNGTKGGHREQCMTAYNFIVRELIQNRGHSSDYFEYLIEEYVVQYHVGATLICYRSPDSMSTLLPDLSGIKPNSSMTASSTVSRVSLPTEIPFEEPLHRPFEVEDGENWEFDGDGDRDRGHVRRFRQRRYDPPHNRG